MSFEPISLKEKHDGLVWSAQVTPQYLAELQTGIVPQLVHLVFFDIENDNAVVHEEVQAFKLGEGLDESNMVLLNAAVTAAIEGLVQ